MNYKHIKFILMRHLELRIPPLVLMFIFATSMGVIAFAVPAPILVPGQLSIAVTLASFGAIVSVAGVVAFRCNKTTVNPMYLGFLLILSGWGVYLSNWVSWILLPIYVAYMSYFQIQPEERALINWFGGHFLSYCNKVRRWV